MRAVPANQNEGRGIGAAAFARRRQNCLPTRRAALGAGFEERPALAGDRYRGEEPVARSLRVVAGWQLFFLHRESWLTQATRAAELFGPSRHGPQLRPHAGGR